MALVEADGAFDDILSRIATSFLRGGGGFYFHVEI